MLEFIDVSNNTANNHVGVRQVARCGFVIHTTVGKDSLSWLQGLSTGKTEVSSADYLVGRRGQIWRITRRGYFAYHAGKSKLHGKTNDREEISQAYIGIEIENNDNGEEEPTEEQYKAGAAIIRVEAKEHRLSPIELYGHANIAVPFGRRSDPTRFDYGRLFYWCANPDKTFVTW